MQVCFIKLADAYHFYTVQIMSILNLYHQQNKIFMFVNEMYKLNFELKEYVASRKRTDS
jgi:hypothetical protein